MTVEEIKAEAAAISAILAAARAEIQPRIDRLQPALDATERVIAAGLDPDTASAADIAKAYADGVDINPPAQQTFPSVLTRESVQAIRDATKGVYEEAVAIGQAVGTLVGKAVGPLL